VKGMNFRDITSSDERVARLMNDPAWVLQQKLDGARVLAHLGTGDGPIFRQRNDGPMKFAAVAQHLRAIHADIERIGFQTPVILDGEVIPSTGVFHVWDMILPDAMDLPYANRLLHLRRTLGSHKLDRVQEVTTMMGSGPKNDLYQRLLSAGAEGAMLKHLDNLYRPGDRVDDAVKVKFVKTAEVIVLEVNRPDARHGSARLGAYRTGANAEMVEVGACSLIGKPHVEPGDVIEIQYLYNSGTDLKPTMYQPRMTKVRPDKAAEDCTIAQFRPYSREVLYL